MNFRNKGRLETKQVKYNPGGSGEAQAPRRQLQYM